MNDEPFFPGFTTLRIGTSETEIRCVVGGRGQPVLLLHGYPQTHAMWHRVAPALARHYRVVCADLRGYGDSGKPPSGPSHAAYSKRAMANDMVELMRDLGHRAFAWSGTIAAAAFRTSAVRRSSGHGVAGRAARHFTDRARCTHAPTRRSRPRTTTGSS